MHVYSPYTSIGYGLSAILRGTCEDRLSGMEKIMMDKELERHSNAENQGPKIALILFRTGQPYLRIGQSIGRRKN